MLTANDVQEMMLAAVSDTRADTLAAIEKVATISRETGDTLRRLMAESFDRPYLDLDAVTLLSESAHILRHLPNTTEQLYSAANILRNLNDNASTLYSAANILRDLESNTSHLRLAAAELDTAMGRMPSAHGWDTTSSELVTVSRDLATVVTSMEDAAHSLAENANTFAVEQAGVGLPWQFLWRGMLIGAVVVALLVLIYQNKGA